MTSQRQRRGGGEEEKEEEGEEEGQRKLLMEDPFCASVCVNLSILSETLIQSIEVSRVR